MVVGTDISELLLKNKTEYPYEAVAVATISIGASSKNSTVSGRNSIDSDIRGVSSHENSPELSAPADSSVARSVRPKTMLSEEEITEKFRNYLLYGSITEALEWATDNNLWGHALFLASKVDRRSHANVLMKFANKLSLNDPLQTLYQLMSGRTPNSVTVCVPIKFKYFR